MAHLYGLIKFLAYNFSPATAYSTCFKGWLKATSYTCDVNCMGKLQIAQVPPLFQFFYRFPEGDRLSDLLYTY